MITAQIYLEDCIPGMAARLEPNSVDLVVSSIPFGALFSYSGKTEDIGNNQDGTDLRAGQFGLHMRFCIEQLIRVMKPGHNACIHIQQLLRYKNQHGYIGRRDFRGAVVDLFCAGGFEWKGEVVIPKNPQIIAKRHNLHCLMFATGKRNSRDLAPAVNDIVMVFQKPGDCAVSCPALFDRDENPGGWITTEEWIRDAHGVWDDILEIDVLKGYRDARGNDDEKHVCPLQLEVIRRCINLYTLPGELVLDPFMGIGSVAYVALGGVSPVTKQAVKEPRAAVGFELKESYHAQALLNVQLAHQTRATAKESDLFKREEVAL
jgi:DNA modification methylase